MTARALRLFTRLVSVLAVVATLIAAPRLAWADSPFDGKWSQGPLTEQYTVQKWQSECGPAPVTGTSGGGQTVTVHEEGDELGFVGGGRVFRTNQCYDELPTLVRETHTRNPNGREWRTRCTTPPTDPRRAVINTLVTAVSDTRIDIIETGRYEISLAGGLCTADIKRSRTLTAISKDTPAPAVTTPPAPTVTSAPTPSPPPDNPSRCASPGEPSRLEVRPSEKLLRTGESFSFRALVLDANGCPTRTAVTWQLTPGDGKGVAVDASGRVTVASDASLGAFDVEISAAGKSAHVKVQVASPSSYDALLSQSGLNDAGESSAAAVALIASSQIGGGDARAEDGARTRKTIFISIIVLMSLALGGVALMASNRSKRALVLEREAQARHAEKVEAAEARRREKAEQHEKAMKAHEESVERARLAAVEAPPAAATAASSASAGRMICPACRREYDSGSAYCASDANRLVPIQGGSDPLAGPGGSICPTCKRGYNPGVKVCPHDKDELIPYALYASRNPGASLPPRGKICPTCGDRFSGGAEFCGKDGTALVLLN